MGWPKWTGVGEREWDKPEGKEVQPSKTLWDLLQLVIVPAILIGAWLWWNHSQTARDNQQVGSATPRRHARQLLQADERSDAQQQTADPPLTAAQSGW